MNKLKLLMATLCVAGALGVQNASAQEAGTYYIQNVGTGKWLGPANAWGSQASVLQHADYWKAAKISDGVYTLEGIVSNGGSSYYLNGTYCDGAVTNFTFTAIEGKENTYSIANASGGYLTTNGTTVDVSATDGTAEASQWKLWSESDMAAGMVAATIENPFDATYLIKDHNINRHSRDYSTVWSNTGATAPKSSVSDGAAVRYSIEAYHTTFDVNQTLSNIPNGVYAVRVNGFYRQDGSNTNLPYVYGNDSKTTLPVRTGTENNMQDAAVSLDAGNYLSEPAYVQVTGGTLKVGVATTGNSCWVIFKNFHLAYYGDVTLNEVQLYEYVKLYNAAMDEAKSYQDVDMATADKTALNTAISDNTLDLGTATVETLTTATANLNAAVDAAKKAVTLYNNYNNIVTTIGGGTNVDLTSFIENPSFETGTTAGWTNAGSITINSQNNASFAKTGTWYAERWHVNGTIDFSQTIGYLPAGVYEATATLFSDNDSFVFFANDNEKPISASGTYSIQIAVDDFSTFKLGVKGTLTNSTWICVDNFTLKYVGALPDELSAVTGKMNADVATAQANAIATYSSAKNAANYNAAVQAIAAAESSVAAYAHLGTAITKIDAALEAATTATASDEDYQAIKTAYDNGTIADNDIQAQIVAAYNAVISVIKSQTAASADFTLAIQNQSFEYGDLTGWDITMGDGTTDTGVKDASNATYAATGSDGYYLFNTYWQGVPLTQTVSGLPNGQYTMTVGVASDGATIYLTANGDHNDGTETGNDEVTTYPGKGQLQEATITFLVKDGNATIGVIGGAGGDAGVHKDFVADGYWWYKADNFRLQKNRDLTAEEQAVKATAIALYNGEEEVTEPIALNATANTVTLTTKLTPDNASEGYIEWTTSDASVATVADGVVTGVAPGTATITATSTLDNTVKATAEVTVTFPETAYEKNSVVNDGAARTTVTLGDNLIQNGSFEYPNGFYGWTNGAGTAMTSANFTITTDGDNKYLQAKESKGVGDAYSIGTAWPIETGKTYVFSYKVKMGAAGNSEFHKVTLTDTPATETEQISVDAKATSTSWTEVSYKFTNTKYAYVQFRARWLGNAACFDDFYLAEVTAEETVGNVDYATAAIPTANIGTGAFQYSQDAIDAANALVQGTATVAEVEAAYEAVTTINEPADGQLFNIVLTYGGWTYDNKAMTYIAGGRTDQGGYNIQYQAEANENLAQAFTFTKAEGNNYKLSQIDADGNVRYMTTGNKVGGAAAGIRTTTDADAAVAFTIIPTATEGVYNIRNNEANNYIGSQDAGVYTVNSHINFFIRETQKPSVAINTTAAGYGTVMLPFAQALPEGVKAYTCGAVEGNTLTLVEVDALEANKPYIIEGAWNATVTGDAKGINLNYTEGLLTGTYAKIAAPNGSYILQNQEGKVGFYKVDTDQAQPNVPANHAYLTVASGSRAFFFGSEATGISAIQALTEGNAQIFDANGRAQQRLAKGLNIIRTSDGKIQKVMVK